MKEMQNVHNWIVDMMKPTLVKTKNGTLISRDLHNLEAIKM